MTSALTKDLNRKTLLILSLLIFCSLLVPLLVFPPSAAATSGSDDFNRADGGLGASWTAIADGGLSIASQAVAGSSGGLAGDIRTGETYAGDQYSQVEVTSNPAQRRPVDRAGGTHPKRRPEHLPGHLLLEQRQPAAEAVRAKRRHLEPARQLLQLRAAGRRHPAEAHRCRLHHLLPARRRHPDRSHRHQPHRRRTRDHVLRRSTRRQLVRRRHHLRGCLFGRWHCFRAVGHGGVAKQQR